MRRPDESVVHGSAASPRDLPSVDRLLQHEAVRAHLAEHGHTLVVAEARALIDGLRADIAAGKVAAAALEAEALAVALGGRIAERLAPRMRTVL